MNQVASKPLKLEVIRDLMIKMNYMDEEEEQEWFFRIKTWR